jgi:hypothetical protein
MSAKLLDRGSVIICSASGQEFRHDGTEASRNAAAAKAAAHQRKYLAEQRQPVHHPETRSTTPEPGLHSTELSRSRTSFIERKPKPSATNPYVGRFETRRDRLGMLWGNSPGGQEYKLRMEAASEQWEQQQDAAHVDKTRREAVEPMAQHALKTLAQADATEGVTQAELEQLRARVDAIRNGTMSADEYKAADQAWRKSQREKREQAAHAHDDQIRTLAGERDMLLAEAWKDDAEPVPEVKAWTPPQPDQLDRTRRAITYPHDHADPKLRGKTIIVSADDPRAIAQ